MYSEQQPPFAMKLHCRHTFATGLLRVFWAIIVFIGELGVFLWTAFGCQWPSIDPGLEYQQFNVPTTHVLLVADTQVQHSALMCRNHNWRASPLRRVLFELNLRKNWYFTSRLKPDAVVFMGDMITNGKAAMSFEEYNAAAQKFKSIFSVKAGTHVYYVPGNNDVGLGLKSPTSQMLRSHYTKSFGPLNQNFVIQNHTFIAVDSPGLIEEDYLRNGRGIPFEEWAPLPDGTVSFVRQVARGRPDPTVLLTHIPLSRSESAGCGPLRERGRIRRGAGPGWQAMISKQSSNFLLRSLQPLIVFSADNRDYCDYTHILPYARPSSAFKRRERIREVTLKSFSPSVHIRRPGFQLVTLIDPDYIPNQLPSPDAPAPQSLTEGRCLLPDQYRIYMSFYSPLFVFTLVILTWVNFHKRQRPGRSKNKLGLAFRRSASTESGSSGSGASSPNYLGIASISDATTPWLPVMRSLSVTPIASPHGRMTLSPNASTAYLGSPKPTSPSSISSTTVLLGDEFRHGYFDEEDDHAIYPPHYSDLSRSDSFGSVAPAVGWGVQISGRHGHVKHNSDVDLEMFHDKQQQLVEFDEEELAGSFHDESKQSEKSYPQWSFVLHGRRRRIRLGLPSQGMIRNFIEFFAFGSWQRLSIIGRRRRNYWLSAFILDVVGVFWVAGLVWVIINGFLLLQLR